MLLSGPSVAQECGRDVDFEFEAHQAIVGDVPVPDSGIAVGPDYIMTTTNWGRRVWDRDGTLQPGSDETLNEFFGFTIQADPVVAFDSDSLR